MRHGHRLVRLGMATCLLIATSCSSGTQTPPPKLRIVLVTLDTLRADALDGSPSGASAMPRLMRYAERGARFQRAFSSSNVTQPTHASLFTGLPPWEHGVTGNGQHLADSFDTVAEKLRDAGFSTGAVVASFPLAERFGFAQGFDVYVERFSRELFPGLATWQGQAIPQGAFYALAQPVQREGLTLLDSLGGDRQFLWLHFFDAHDPYGDASASGDETVGYPELLEALGSGDPDLTTLLERARALYRRDLLALDEELGLVFDRLERDAADFGVETHVIVTADHGESFGEGGHLTHGESLGLQEIHVPLFIVSPAFAAGARADPASSMDVAQTLLALAGLDDDLPGARDLARDSSHGAGRAVGMSRWLPASRKPGAAREGPFEEPRFFAASADGLDVGSATEVPRDSELADEFAEYARVVRTTSAPLRLDAESLEALRALGYVE